MKFLLTIHLIFILFAAGNYPVFAEQERYFGNPYDSFLIDSKYVNQTFEIHVSVSTACKDGNAKCPVLYFSGADGFFSMLSEMSFWLHQYSLIPASVVVRIGYPW
mgnify:CR=1 FL=1